MSLIFDINKATTANSFIAPSAAPGTGNVIGTPLPAPRETLNQVAGTSTGTNGTYTDPAVAQQQQEQAATQAFYDDQIRQLNGQLGNLDGQQNVGLGNISNSYNLSANRLGQQNAVAKRNYDTGVQDNTQNYVNTRGGIMNNVRNNSNALQRLLGMAGSGNSSAAYEQAPYAAALQGSQNLNSAQTNFRTNARSLDTSWEDTQRAYNNGLEDLGNQKYSQENSLKSSIAQTRAGLLDKIAAATANRQLAGGASYQQALAAKAPYQDQVNSLLQQITQLGNQFANPVMRTADIAYKTPELSQYSLGNRPQIGGGQGGGGNIDPVLGPVIAPKERDEFGNIITA